MAHNRPLLDQVLSYPISGTLIRSIRHSHTLFPVLSYAMSGTGLGWFQIDCVHVATHVLRDVRY
eukprot:3864308-Rhodomonas_salina.2